jgi:hypothetical protein
MNMNAKTDLNELQHLFSEITPEIEPRITGFRMPYTLYRYDLGNDRYYFEYPVTGEAIPYLSVTAWTKKVLGESEYLGKWRGNVGNDYADWYSGMRAERGSLGHMLVAEIERTGEGSFRHVREMAYETAIEKGYPHQALAWQDSLVNDIACWMQFRKERNLEVLGAEVCVRSTRYGLAGAIDMICRLDFGKDRVNAIIDMKFGNVNEEHHALQLNAYKTIWNDDFKDYFEVSHVFNWSPNKYTSRKPYTLKNQTDSTYAKSVRERMGLAKLEGMIQPPKAALRLDGDFTTEDFEIDNHIQKYSI